MFKIRRGSGDTIGGVPGTLYITIRGSGDRFRGFRGSGDRVPGPARPGGLLPQGPGKEVTLPPPPPLRTARESFPSCSPRLHERPSQHAAAFCQSFLHMDLPMTVDMQQLQVVGRARTASAAPYAIQELKGRARTTSPALARIGPLAPGDGIPSKIIGAARRRD
jgi:hypothetical protein